TAANESIPNRSPTTSAIRRSSAASGALSCSNNTLPLATTVRTFASPPSSSAARNASIFKRLPPTLIEPSRATYCFISREAEGRPRRLSEPWPVPSRAESRLRSYPSQALRSWTIRSRPFWQELPESVHDADAKLEAAIHLQAADPRPPRASIPRRLRDAIEPQRPHKCRCNSPPHLQAAQTPGGSAEPWIVPRFRCAVPSSIFFPKLNVNRSAHIGQTD